MAVDSKCVEGYTFEECPHFTKVNVQDIQEIDVSPPASPIRPPVIELYTGLAENRQQASLHQRSRISRTIGIIGPHFSGKTSLIASIFDLLQERLVIDYSFAGSSTMVGFEKVCHDARAPSRRAKPHTERTIRGADATFLHLDIGRPKESDIISLFLADRSGEDYLTVADNISQAKGYFELFRADTITVLVNGEHLIDSRKRHEVRAALPQLVSAMREAGAIRGDQRIAVVLTKNDIVLESAHADRANSDFDKIVWEIQEGHCTERAEIERFIIAASPESTDRVARGEGVAELLAYWLCPRRPDPAPSADKMLFPRFIDLLEPDTKQRQ